MVAIFVVLAQASAPIPSGAADRFIQSGLLGTALVVAVCVIAYLYREQRVLVESSKTELKAAQDAFTRERTELNGKITEVQNARIGDIQAFNREMSELVKTGTAALTNTATMLENQSEERRELKEAFQALCDEIRTRRPK